MISIMDHKYEDTKNITSTAVKIIVLRNTGIKPTLEEDIKSRLMNDQAEN